MASALYTPEILRLATQIPHLARLKGPVTSLERRAPLCGSWIAVDVVLDSDGRVSDFGQEVRACALGQASASLMGREILGRSGEELGKVAKNLLLWLKGEGEMPDWPGLRVFEAARGYPGRHGAISLPFEAIDAAVQLASGGKTVSGRSAPI